MGKEETSKDKRKNKQLLEIKKTTQHKEDQKASINKTLLYKKGITINKMKLLKKTRRKLKELKQTKKEVIKVFAASIVNKDKERILDTG